LNAAQYSDASHKLVTVGQLTMHVLRRQLTHPGACQLTT
jgi:hypothetical protein